MQARLFPVLVLLLSSSACVSKGTYEEAVQSGDAARAQVQRESARLDELTKLRDAVQTQLDAQDAANAELRAQLAQLEQSSQQLAADKGSLASALDQVRRAQAGSELRARFFRDLAMRLKSMVDAGNLAIALRDGRMVLQLPNDVLFASGQVDLQPRGRDALVSIASVLKTIPNRRFQVAGHTDDVPIDTGRFPSNWELSSARALEVTRFLVAQGVSPTALSAAAYAEHDPIAPNKSARDRARNRRIEITVQPNIEELVYVPELR